MAYVPDPTDSSQPTDGNVAETAQAEFRALKAYIAGFISGGLNGVNIFRKNKIINGGMNIDQRNRGGVYAGIGALTRTLDQWSWQSIGGAGNISIQQKQDTPPDGFSSYSRLTVTLADAAPAVGASSVGICKIEGYNVADLAMGSAAAQTTSLSFYARCSVAGTYNGSVADGIFGRSYPFTFVIPVANAWTRVTINNIPGDLIAGTYDKTTGIGLQIVICISSGTNFVSATPNVWQAGNFFNVAGTTNLMATLNATFDITGVQLEKGAAASVFEFRSIGQELELCARYLPVYIAPNVNETIVGMGQCQSGAGGYWAFQFPVPTRIPPTGITVSNAGHFVVYPAAGASIVTTSVTFNDASLIGGRGLFAVAAGLAAGNATSLASKNALAQILFTGAEL